MDDRQWMEQALGLARRGLGRVAPNPAVGCVLVKDDQIVGRGRTGDGGRPHAETQALRQAGEAARGSTAYVTLEPCSHHGATGPCADALIAAGIAACVVAVGDPDPRVAGRGLARLREAGIAVREGVGAEAANRLNAGFFSRVERGRPLVALKVATSADGFVADAEGRSHWITGEAARALGHRLRGLHDAVLTGSGTLLADDPLLTCRLPGTTRQPLRIVLDRRLRMPADGRLARSVGDGPVRVLTAMDASEKAQPALEAAGVAVVRLEDAGAEGVLRHLAESGLTRVLIEAGPLVTTAFLPFADELHWFRAPILLGMGRPVFSPLGALGEAPRAVLAESREIGGDRYERYRLGAT